MTESRIVTVRLTLLSLVFALVAAVALAQGGRELPIEKPRERTSNDAPKVRPPVRQAANVSTIVVLLNPIVTGQVVVKSTTGRVLKQGEADQEGQATFSLPRGQSYQVDVSSPGYSSGSATVKAASSLSFVRINLNAESRVIRLQNVPQGAEVLIDGKSAPVSVIAGLTTVAGVTPRKHKLTVRHPEYNDYTIDVDLTRVGIGELMTVPVQFTRVAKLTIQSVADAEIMIDGAFKGRVPAAGSMIIEVPITQVAEHTISAEKPGYIAKSLKEKLSAGPRTLVLDLEPFANPEGASDGYDNLNQWNAPSTWKVEKGANNRTLQVSGTTLGLLKDKVYKDFQAVFTVWIPDGKGATWAIKADPTGKNYYLFHLAGPRSTTHIPNRFYTYVVKDGKAPVEVNTPTPLVVDLNSTSSFLIHVVARGYTIEHSITSNETGEKVTLGLYTDSSPTKDKFLYGLFGFRAYGTEMFVVDDFTIDPSRETVPTRPR